MFDTSADYLENLLPARLKGHMAAVAILAIVCLPLTAIDTGPYPPPQPYHFQVDANTATVGILDSLPHMGPSVASRIVEARRSQPFQDLNDLDNRVKGVGPSLRSFIAPFLYFSQQSDNTTNAR